MTPLPCSDRLRAVGSRAALRILRPMCRLELSSGATPLPLTATLLKVAELTFRDGRGRAAPPFFFAKIRGRLASSLLKFLGS